MRALSLWQPWAGCIAWLGKDVENRSWRCPANVIGEQIAIHAARRVDKGRGLLAVPCPERWPELFASRAEWDTWRAHGNKRRSHGEVNWPARLPLGAVQAAATIASCHHSDECPGNPRACPPGLCSPWAAPGEWHWQLAGVRPLARPVPCQGKQGLWLLPGPVEAQVRAQLAEAA